MRSLLRPNRWLLHLPTPRVRHFELPKNYFQPRRWRDEPRYRFAKPVLAGVGLADPRRSPRFIVGSFAVGARQSRGKNGVVFGSDCYRSHRVDASMPSPKTIRSFRTLAPGICAFPDFLSDSRFTRCLAGRILV